MTDQYFGLEQLFQDQDNQMDPAEQVQAGASRTDDADLSAMTKSVEEFTKTMGTAKELSSDVFRRKTRRIYKLFADAGATDEKKVRQAMAYYFMVHGVSVNTPWNDKEPIVSGGASVPSLEVVNVVKSQQDGAAATLRNFASQMLHAESDILIKVDAVRQKMAERAIRIGLTAEEVDAINELSKSYDPAKLGNRVRAKYAAVALREKSGMNITQRTARAVGDSVQDNADGRLASSVDGPSDYL